MHISIVKINNFRGLQTEIELTAPSSLIVGPNNAGKSSVIDALRATLESSSRGQGQYWLRKTDFRTTPDRTSAQPGDQVTVELVIENIPKKHQGALISILAPQHGENCGKMRMTATLNANGRIHRDWTGGDFLQNSVEQLVRENILFTYLPPLRDASTELRPGASNKHADVLDYFHQKTKTADGDKEADDALEEILRDAHTQLTEQPGISNARAAIGQRLKEMTGAREFEHQTDLSFAPPRYERIISSIQGFMGKDMLRELTDSGLGFSNLYYMAVLLSALEADETVALSLLLIEEPEAHLHPQLQSSLMRYMDSLSSNGSAQVISTTHSPQLASAASVSRITVLSNNPQNGEQFGRSLYRANLSDKEVNHLRRFLDMTKSSMLFGGSVILVEGLAELLLIPVLASLRGEEIAHHGATVVSVDGLSFEPFMKLYKPDCLPFKCLVLSDSDRAQAGDTEISATATKLISQAQDNRAVTLAHRTFEWDLARCNYTSPMGRRIITKAMENVRPIKFAELDACVGTESDFADLFLAMVEKHKGMYAQCLADVIVRNREIAKQHLVIPQYIADGLDWLFEPVSAQSAEVPA